MIKAEAVKKSKLLKDLNLQLILIVTRTDIQRKQRIRLKLTRYSGS